MKLVVKATSWALKKKKKKGYHCTTLTYRLSRCWPDKGAWVPYTTFPYGKDKETLTAGCGEEKDCNVVPLSPGGWKACLG